MSEVPLYKQQLWSDAPDLIFTLPHNSSVNLADFAVHMNLQTNIAGQEAGVDYAECTGCVYHI